MPEDDDAGKKVYIPRPTETSRVVDIVQAWGRWASDQVEATLPASNLSIQGIGFSGKSTFLHRDVLPALAILEDDDGNPLPISTVVIDSQVNGRRKDALEAVLEIRAKLHMCSPTIATNHLE